MKMDKFEMTLQECESQKKAILDCSEDIILLLGRDLRVLWANNSARKLCADPVGKRCNELFCSTDAKCLQCRVVAGFHGESGSTDEQTKAVVAANGSDLFFQISSTPVKTNSAEIEKIVVVARDITEKLQLKKQLRHASKMEAIGTLAGGIAHDFNNILTPIMGYAEIMKINFLNKQLDREESISYVEQILQAAKRAHKLVEQILIFSRNTEINESLQSIQPIIKEGLKLIHATIPSTIEIRQEIDEGCGMVNVDPIEIHQILINLCKNAADAMAGRRGILKVALKQSENSTTAGTWLELSVSDNGCGIAPEILDKIFNPYFTTKEKVQGTGMGLAMVHGIINRQGGMISVDSVVDKGTTITLHLPVVQEKIDLDKDVGLAAWAGENEHILLVDDEKQVIDANAVLLRKLGYRVTAITSAREALLEFFKNQTIYDLVITDLTMPYMTGIDLCEKIKEMRSDIPVLLFSGFLENFSRARAMAAGIDGFCLKPVALREMARNIRKVLS
jgi:signal transduction histidine kinase/CheY-like chemotaxis protein